VYNDNSCAHTGVHDLKFFIVDLGAVYELST
jgi:hypothetical protein